MFDVIIQMAAQWAMALGGLIIQNISQFAIAF